MEPGGVAKLVAQCVEGREDAKARFVVEYGDVIRRAVTFKLTSLTQEPALRSDVEDLCHDVFARLFRDNCAALARLIKPESVRAWLITISQNCVVDHVRKWLRRKRLQADLAREQELDYTPRTTNIVAAEEKRKLLHNHVALLEPQDRLVLDLFYLHELRYAEIAEVMGMNINTVSARLRRAKEKLRKLIKERDDGLEE